MPRVLTEEQKQKARERAKAWALANPERAKANKKKAYRAKADRQGVVPFVRKTEEELKEAQRQRYLRYMSKPEKREKVYARNRARAKTPAGIKCSIICNWKRLGIVCDYDEWYERYVTATQCELCELPLGTHGDGTGMFRTLDHDHTTGKPRNVLCQRCNILRS